MRLSDLLGCDVFDASGTSLGRVSDVRLVQDGPLLAGITAAFRVDAIVFGRFSLAERLGYLHGGVDRPVVLAWLLRRVARRTHLLAWEAVDEWDEASRRVTLRPDVTPEPL
jgi:PRC-barrel domain protein